MLVPLLKAEGFEVRALWCQSDDEARCLAVELGIPFHTSRSDDVLLHQDVDLVCIYIPPSMTRQIAVKALGKLSCSRDAFQHWNHSITPNKMT